MIGAGRGGSGAAHYTQRGANARAGPGRGEGATVGERNSVGSGERRRRAALTAVVVAAACAAGVGAWTVAFPPTEYKVRARRCGWLAMRATHPLMMRKASVIDKMLRWLETGRFASPAAEHPPCPARP